MEGVGGLDVPVISEVILSSKGLAADIAAVRPLVCVCSLVNQQVVRLREMSLTVFADKLFLRSKIM